MEANPATRSIRWSCGHDILLVSSAEYIKQAEQVRPDSTSAGRTISLRLTAETVVNLAVG